MLNANAVCVALPNGLRTDPSVIGRPFALSVSMQGELKKNEVFRAARERLEQMAREPRDNGWASLKESQIQDLMMSNGTYIRNIECRTTTCAVEVAPASDPFDVTTTEQQLKNLDLWGPEYLTFYFTIELTPLAKCEYESNIKYARVIKSLPDK